MKWRNLLLLVPLLAVAGSILVSQPAAAAPKLSGPVLPVTLLAVSGASCNNHGGFFGLDPWYKYMGAEFGANCDVKCFNLFPRDHSDANDCGQTRSDVPGILLVVVDDLLRIAALAAIGYILYGSFQYVASRGNSDQTAQARGSIINALIGLVIAMAAVGFIAFLGTKLT